MTTLNSTKCQTLQHIVLSLNQAQPLASGDPLSPSTLLTGLELFAAAICHDGIAALPVGAPVLKGLELRAWRDAIASVPVELLTEAGFGVEVSLVVLPLTVLPTVGSAGVDGPVLVGRTKEVVLEVGAGFIRWPIKVFKLLSSAFNSLNLLSVFSF